MNDSIDRILREAAGRLTCSCGTRAFLFMIHDHLWLSIAADDPRQILCVTCVEARLGRQLTPADFTPARLNAPILWGMTRSA